jgi:hypothetical protein
MEHNANTENKKAKIKVALSEKDDALLLQYAKERGVSRAVAAKQIIHQFFTANKNGVATEFVPKNQLSLFDCNYQVTLFDIIEKEEKKKAKSSKKAEE